MHRIRTRKPIAALKLFVDNWRWQDVPFYLRAGKRMARQVTEIAIHFRPVPHRLFPSDAVRDWQPTRVIMSIQPDEGIVLRCYAKQPGHQMRLRQVDMRFSYREAFKTPSPPAYATLLRDVMVNDATLFMRNDQVEAAWAALMPVLEAWNADAGRRLSQLRGRHWRPRSLPTNCSGAPGMQWRSIA